MPCGKNIAIFLRRSALLVAVLALAAPVYALNFDDDNGEEVIVHVYRQKEDPAPFIEFSVVVRTVDGIEHVQITQVYGKRPEKGFMKITGVSPAGDIGVVRSDRYEISFQQVGDYKVYEKAVMDYLRQLPVPEIEADVKINVEAENLFDLPDESNTRDLGDIVLDPLLDVGSDQAERKEIGDEPELSRDFAADVPKSAPVETDLLRDSLSAMVHVHRDAEDIDPFKEFVVTMYRDEAGRKQAKVVEVKGVKSGTRFIIMTGFEEREGEGVVQSFAYDVNSYNVEDSEVYEQAVIEFMNKLTTAQFSGEEPTIGLNWEAALEPKEAVQLKPEPKFQVSYNKKEERKKKKKEMSQRQIDKLAKKTAKELEQAKYEAPKRKNKYGKRKSDRMTTRMAKFNKRKVQCPTIRGH